MRTKNELNRRLFLKCANLVGLAACFRRGPMQATNTVHLGGSSQSKELPPPETILLKDYRPRSIYQIPVTEIDKAKYPIIDMHSHPYAKTAQQIEEWIKNMDEVGVQKTVILTMETGSDFDDVYRKYSKHPERFVVWFGSIRLRRAGIRRCGRQGTGALQGSGCTRRGRNPRQGGRAVVR